MQSSIIIALFSNQFDQFGEGPLSLHQLESAFHSSAVEEQERSRDMQYRRIVLLHQYQPLSSSRACNRSAHLQQAVQHLAPHIALVGLEQARLEQLVATSRYVVFGLQVFLLLVLAMPPSKLVPCAMLGTLVLGREGEI